MQIVANLTMAPALFGYHAVDGSYWSLTYELTFYGLAASAYLIWRWKPEVPCICWLATALLIRACGTNIVPERVQILGAVGYAHFFIIGIMLYRIHARQVTWLTHPLLATSLALTILGPTWTLRPIPGFAFFGVITSFAILIWVATTARTSVLQIPPLLFLGRISYPLYLIHQRAGFAFIGKLEAIGMNPTIAVLVTIVFAVLLAWTISTIIERPAQRRLRKLFSAYRHKVVGLAPMTPI